MVGAFFLSSSRAVEPLDPIAKNGVCSGYENASPYLPHIIAQTIADIEALNADRKAAKEIIDHGWTEKRFLAVEKEAMASFEVVAPHQRTGDSPDGYGRSVNPVKPAKPTRAKPADNGTDEPGAGAYQFRD